MNVLTKIFFWLVLSSSLLATDVDTLYLEDTQIRYDYGTVEAGTPSASLQPGYAPAGDLTPLNTVNSNRMISRILVRPKQSEYSKLDPAKRITSVVFVDTIADFSGTDKLLAWEVFDTAWHEGTGNSTVTYWGHAGACWYKKNNPAYPETTMTGVPAEFNWIDQFGTTPIREQGGCNSCGPHATIGVIEQIQKSSSIGWTTTWNSEDGTGADRSTSAVNTQDANIAGNDTWRVDTIPSTIFETYYSDTLSDCGFIWLAQSGAFKIASTEYGTSNLRPVWNLKSIIVSSGLFSELTIRITSSDLVDAAINYDAQSTNYGSGDTVQINSNISYLQRCDRFKAKVDAAITAAGGGTLYGFDLAVCSTRTITEYGSAQVKICELKKYKFNESTATYLVWDTNKEWGLAGAKKLDQSDLSEQQIMSCVSAYNNCLNRWSFSDGILHFMTDSMWSEEDFPYLQQDGVECPATPYVGQGLVTHMWRIWGTTRRDLQKAIMQQPIAVTCGITGNPPTLALWDYSIDDKVWENNASASDVHLMEAVGWCDTCTHEDGVGYWIVKNSWGTDWGKQGIGYLSYDGLSKFENYMAIGTGNWSMLISMTVTPPEPWDTAGGRFGVDYSAQPFDSTGTITSNQEARLDIPVGSFYDTMYGQKGGWMLGVRYTSSNATVGLQMNSDEAATRKPFLIVTQEDAVTIMGDGIYGTPSKLGN